MSKQSNTSSRSTLKSSGFPVAIRASEDDGVWNSIRADQQEEDKEFEMKDRQYKTLQAPSGTIELGGLINKLLFLPTLEYWQVLVTFSTIIVYVLGMYCMFFVPEHLEIFKIMIIFYIMCDLIYLVDFIINMIHRYSKKVKQKFQLKHKRLCLLLIDFLSLLPQELLIASIIGFRHWSLTYYRCIIFVRLYRVLQLFGVILRSVRSSRWRWFLIQYVVLFSMALHTAVCIWYVLGPRTIESMEDSEDTYWLSRLFTTHSKFVGKNEWYLYCLYIAVNSMSNTGFGDFYATRLVEGIYSTAVMLIGFILAIVLIAVLIVQLVNVGYRRAKFSFEVVNVRNVLKQIHASPELTKQVLGYYDVLWVNKNGVNEAPELYTLPSPLRMELMYDINIAHLQNSLLLKHQPEALLRKISLLVKHVFLLPGDVVFHQGVVKGKMVFVAGGVLEILSDEDDESPIISFRAGTVLGEVALVMSVPAKATVRAATYVELQVIERIDFMRMMLDHPDATMQIRQNIMTRLEKADIEQGFSDKDNVIMNLLVSNVTEYRPIRLLKDHLSNFTNEDTERAFRRSLGFVDEQEPGPSDQRVEFITEYLPLYKLSPNVTMIEPEKICISANFPWIFRPRSSLIYCWTNLVNITQVILCLILPYYVVYVRDIPHGMALYCHLADAIYLIDLVVSCSTAVEIRNMTIRRFKKIMHYRMRFISFYTDVFSVFPIEVMVYAIYLPELVQNRIFYLLKLNRLLRIWRLNKIFVSLENNMFRNILVLTVIKYTVYLIIAAFWVGALMYVETCAYPICTKTGWFHFKMLDSLKLTHVIACHEYPVAISTYFGIMALFLVGYGDILPTHKNDVLCLSLLMLVGIFLICYCTAQLSATFSLSDRFRREFQENVVAFGRFLEQNSLMHSLYKRVITFFCLQWYCDRGTGREFVIDSAPPHLRSALQTTELKEALSKTPLFEMVDIDFLLLIAECARVQTLPSDEVIVYMGDMSREMYIVLSGHCEVLSETGTVLHYCGPGEQFGVVEMIYGIPIRYTTRTVTNCKVISIDYRSYVQAISMFPNISEEMKLVMEEADLFSWVRQVDNDRGLLKPLKKPDSRRKITQRLSFCCRVIAHFVKKSFVFTKSKCKQSEGKEKYWEPFSKMGRYKFVGYLLLPFAIHPEGPFIRVWCFIRVIFILFLCMVGPFYIAVTPYASDLYWFILAANLCAYIDIYLLLHMGYYNEKGLLVTHPKYTAWNYLTHSFTLDILGVFPLHLLIAWENPSHSEGHDYVTHLVTPHLRHCIGHLNVLVQYHRILELFHYLEGDVMLKNMARIRFLKFLPLSVVLINLITSLVFSLDCAYVFYNSSDKDNNRSVTLMVYDFHTDTEYYGYLKCRNGSWLGMSQFRAVIKNPLHVYVVGFYWITSTLLGVGLGDISAFTVEGMYIVVITILIGRLFFAYVFANLAIGRAQLSIVMSKYQENLQDLMNFLNREQVDLHWQRKIRLHFEYVWSRTGGSQPQELCQKLNTSLIEDTVVYLYEVTLREVPLFENVEKSFIRVIAKHLTQEYFLRGDTVIKSFDIQSNIYIIHRGKAEVLSSYNEMIACMGPGGLFGNISQVNAGCSTVSVIASRNLDVLVITSETFFGVIKDYPHVKRNMDSLLQTAKDYIMPTTIIDDEVGSNYNTYFGPSPATAMIEIPSQGSTNSTGDSRDAPRRSFGSYSASSYLQFQLSTKRRNDFKQMFNLCLPYKWFRFSIYPDHIIIQATTTAVLLVAYYDVFVILYCFVTQNDNWTFLICSLVLELVFYFRIFLQFHIAVMDRYGNYITRFKGICRHYFSNPVAVFWDIVPNLPVEPFCFLFEPEDKILSITSLRLLHLLRMKYMLDYFGDANKRLNANLTWNQILKIGLFITIGMHVFSCIWLMIACPFNNCTTNSWGSLFKFSANEVFYRYAAAGYYVIGLITTTGSGDVFPTTFQEVVFTTIVMMISKFLTALVIEDYFEVMSKTMNAPAYYRPLSDFNKLTWLVYRAKSFRSNLDSRSKSRYKIKKKHLYIGDMVTMIHLASRSLVHYEYRISCLQDYLQNQYLSGHQMEKLWSYVKNLWAQEKGQHIPRMLQDCPYVLRCDVMNVMFGHHLRNSFLFKGVNEALLRQLAFRLNRIVFFPGNYIVQDGDIDQNMYFIHNGEVSVLTVHSNLTETQHELLKSNDMFGLGQGLYHGFPHRFSFRANTKVSILVLNLDTWIHMLRYFPNDKRIIYNRAQTVYTTV